MASLFTRIVKKELPCHKLAETEDFLSFLDIRPVTPGHALVIPKQEIDYIFDLPDHLLAAMMPFAKRVALAIEQVISCQRVGVMVAGLEVPHAHIHLIPIQSISDLNFSHAKAATNQELELLAKKIKVKL